MCVQFLKSSFSHPLARRMPIQAISRYVKWQMLSRLTGKDLKFTVAGKAKFKSRRGWPVSNAAYYFGLSEFETMAFLLHLLREGDLFVDAGAHIGTYSVLVAALTGARVVAFEPHPGARAFLQEHVVLNTLSESISVRACALGDAEGEVTLTSDLGLNNFITSDEKSAGLIPTPLRTLDSVCEEVPAAIKIDVEGFELMVLQGADRILSDSRLKAVCIETMGLGIRYGRKDQEVLQYLYDRGFEAVAYQPFKRHLIPLSGQVGMTICVRDAKDIQSKLTQSSCNVLSWILSESMN